MKYCRILTHNYPNPEDLSEGIFVKHHQELCSFNSDICYINFKSVRNSHNFSKLIELIKFTYNCFYKIKKGGKYINTIAHWWIPCGVLAAMSNVTNLTVICHGTDLYLLQRHRYIAKILTPLVKRVSSWQCVSNDLKDTLKKIYPQIKDCNILVEPMPVNTKIFNKSPVKRIPNFLVSVGSLIPRKNMDVLIKAFNLVDSGTLYIYGEGPEYLKLYQLINDHTKIKLMGNVSQIELAKVFQRASLFTLLSEDEGYGMVLAEAKNCGCYTLGVNYGGSLDTHPTYTISREDMYCASTLKNKIEQIFKQVNI